WLASAPATVVPIRGRRAGRGHRLGRPHVAPRDERQHAEEAERRDQVIVDRALQRLRASRRRHVRQRGFSEQLERYARQVQHLRAADLGRAIGVLDVLAHDAFVAVGAADPAARERGLRARRERSPPLDLLLEQRDRAEQRRARRADLGARRVPALAQTVLAELALGDLRERRVVGEARYAERTRGDAV